MENLPPNIGRIPNTSSKIPIGAITNAMFAYVIPALQAVVKFPSANWLHVITLVCMASYKINAMKKNRIETTIPIIPIPIGMIGNDSKGYLNKI